MAEAAELKRLAAEHALGFVQSGTRVGLGTGSTAEYVVTGLGRLLREGQLADVACVPTSKHIEELARAEGIELVELDESGLDLAIDGCDEVDSGLRAIKGLGGALTREKLVARAARDFVLIADDSKLVARLGERAPVPVEIVAFGWRATRAEVERRTGSTEPRMNPDGSLFVTDNGNVLLDLRPGAAFDPERLARNLKAISGVVEHGLFLTEARLAVIAGPGGVEVMERA